MRAALFYGPTRLPVNNGQIFGTVGTVERNNDDKLSDVIGISDFPTAQAALNFGRTVTIKAGVYNLAQTPTMPATPVNIEAESGVQVSGNVTNGNWNSIPTFGHCLSNEYNLIDYSYKYAAPNIARVDPGAPGAYPFGSFTQCFEMVPGVGFRGNADAAYFGTIGNSGVNAALGAINALSVMQPGFLGNANVAEFDINNFAAAMKGLGIVIQGVGTYKLDSAIKIVRIAYGSQSTTGAGGNWIPAHNIGVEIQNCEQGIVVDQTQVQNPQHGLKIKPGPQRAADQPAIAIETPDGNVPYYVRADGYVGDRKKTVVSAFGAGVITSGVSGQTATQYLRADAFVQLAGSVIASGANVASGTTLFTLDAAFRPNRVVILPAMMNNGVFAWVQIAADGSVTCGSALTNAAALDLDSISYRLSN